MIPIELVSIFKRLQIPEIRSAATRELAVFTNTTEVLVFGKDEEIGIFLPAPGLPQTLRQGGRWQTFLGHCAAEGTAGGAVPATNDDVDLDAMGIADELGLSIMVFLGARPAPVALQWISALLPLLGAKLAIERTALASSGHAAAARDASRRAGALNAALDANRRELQSAYERAERELIFRREAESRLREADRRKDDFLAMLAHELRNPLAPISMAAQILRLPSVPPERLRQTSEIIERQIGHMTSLLDDLLDVSRVTRGLITLDHEAVDVGGIIADAIEQARPLIEARHHRLTVQLAPESVRVLGDRTRLVQVVTNLLNNATKFTPEGGDILLRLEPGPQYIGLCVRDTGVGMDAQLLPRVFDLFTQGERSSDRSQGGLGLGLALVKSLVELHGGKVAAYSAGHGTGSEFSINLPRLDGPVRQTEAPRARNARQSAPGELCVMIVDDNADAAQTMAAFLEATGYRVCVAYDGHAAIAMARDETPHVFLLDIGLPDMDGYELARSLRAQAHSAGSVLIALTGYGQAEDQERSRSAGFDHHLTKPADPARLVELLSAVSGEN
ncbi:MAG: Signal transduction histidine kinase [Herminiimonas sp.]|nr:Signal transduction histidine kinase [Herminiimonas sp.]